MVGRETLRIAVAGLPAMKFLGSVSVSAVSGPLAGRASGTLPGQMGIWVWPGEGCQTGCWALTAMHADATQTTTSKGFIQYLRFRISDSSVNRNPTGYGVDGVSKAWVGAERCTGHRCGAACQGVPPPLPLY